MNADRNHGGYGTNYSLTDIMKNNVTLEDVVESIFDPIHAFPNCSQKQGG